MLNCLEIIKLFHEKPRHAGRFLAKSEELSCYPGLTSSEKAYNYCFPGAIEKFNGCLACHKKFSNFISFKQGYRSYCSYKCSNGSTKVKESKKLGMLKKHGVENPMQSALIRAKAQATNLARYGSITPLRQASVQAKVKSTILKQYGVDHAFKLESVKCNARSHQQLSYIKQKWANRLSTIEKNLDVTLLDVTRNYQGPNFEYSWQHKCGQVYKSQISSGMILTCPRCKLKYRSSGEVELGTFIKELTMVSENDRSIVRPYELDIYCPELKLAVEYNGLYWHSDEWKRSDYHLKKLNACLKKGIRLVHVFEDEWLTKKDIVKSKISSILGATNKLHARNCEVKLIDHQQAEKFLSENHLLGSCVSMIQLGLFFGDDLISLMMFGPPYLDDTFNWELLRCCSATGTMVVGGASKLLKSFRKQYPGSIITYSDRRWSDGHLYRALGMVEETPTKPAYFYFKNGTRIDHHQTLKLFGDKFDKELTEKENMRLAGYRRIYDCGNLVFSLK